MKRLILLSIILALSPFCVLADETETNIGPHYDETNGYQHSDSTYCHSGVYKGQQFTTGDESFTVRSIVLYGKLGKGDPKKVIVSIHSVDDEGLPIGDALTTSGEVDCSKWSVYFGWHGFDVPEYELLATTMYAIVVSNPSGDVKNFVRLSFTHSPTYEGGSVVRSSDGGVEWVINPNADFAFRLMSDKFVPEILDPIYEDSDSNSGIEWVSIPIVIFVGILLIYIRRRRRKRRLEREESGECKTR